MAALDIAPKRIGVAVSDELRVSVRPLGSVPSRDAVHDARRIAPLLEGLDVGLLVVGLPLLASGDEGPSAARARERGEAIAHRLGIPHAFHDEWGSTLEARQRMSRHGSDVDAAAAAIILEDYLGQQERSS